MQKHKKYWQLEQECGPENGELGGQKIIGMCMVDNCQCLTLCYVKCDALAEKAVVVIGVVFVTGVVFVQ